MLSSKIKRTVAVAMATAMMMTSVLPASASEFTSEADEIVTSEAQAESNVEETPEVAQETAEESEEVSEETSEETSETEDSEASQPEESEVEESETSEESSEEASSESSEESSEETSEEEITLYDEATLREYFVSSAASKQTASAIDDNTTIVPGTYTITANLYVPGSLNKVLTGIDAYLTNPNNPLGTKEDNGEVQRTAPTVPMVDNATITVDEDGTKTVELDVKNPVFTLQEIHDGSNVTILDQTRNSNVYGPYTGRVTHLKVQLGDNSGSYSFTDCAEYPTLLNQTWTVPLALAVDLASLPVEITLEQGDAYDNAAYDESVEPKYGIDWIASASYDNFASAEVDGETLQSSGDGPVYSCFAYQGKTYFSLPSSYCEEFTSGEHTLTLNFKDGSKATTKFTVTLNKVQEKAQAFHGWLDSTVEYSGDVYYALDKKGCYTIEGTNSASKVGNYHVKVTLLDGYTWDDGTTDVVEFDWAIKALEVAKPEVTETNFKYTGEDITVLAEGDGYTLDGDAVASKVGTYKVTVSPSEGYVWSDGTSDSFVIEWKIEGTKTEKPVAKTNLTYTGEEITGVEAGEGYTLDENAKATKVGTYTVIATLNDGYEWADGTTGIFELTWEIKGVSVKKPLGSAYTYTGDVRTVVPENEAYTIEGENTGTDVGLYTVTVTLNDGYVWADGSTEPAKVSMTILAQKVAKPTTNDSHIYDFDLKCGFNVNYNGNNVVSKAYTVSENNRQRFVGTYTSTVTLNKNYVWEDGTTDVLTHTWTIDPATAKKSDVYLISGEFTYDGKIHVPTIHGCDGVTMSGGLYGINAGTYRVNVGVDEKGYIWDDGTKDTVYIDWVIKPISLDKPEATNFTYDGEEHTVINENDGYTIDGVATATDAGNYEVTVTPKQNYAWADGSTDAVILKWSIARATCEKPSVQTEFDYTGKYCFPITKADTGISLSGQVVGKDAGTYKVTVGLKPNYAWADGSVDAYDVTWVIKGISVEKPETANFTFDGDDHTIVTENEAYTIDGVATASAVGDYEVTLTLNKNYEWSDGTTDPYVLKWSIGKITVAAPAVKELTYTGDTLVGVEAATGYTLDGVTSAINAGTYEAVATLEDNYVWENGSSDPLTITWTIAKADQKIKTSFNYKTFTVWNMRKSDKSVNIDATAKTEVSYKITRTPTGGYKYVVLGQDGSVTLKKGAIKGTYQITVTAPESENYNAATKNIMIYVVKSPNALTTEVSSKTYTVSSLAKASKSFEIGAAAKTEITYKVTRTPNGGYKYITVDDNGKVTLKKGAIKGTYQITVNAVENDTHRSASTNVMIYVK